MSKRLRYGAALLATLVAAGPAAAQSPSAANAAPAYRESGSSALARHIRTLASSPRNLPALLGAGRAALEVGDTQAALAFFARAEEVAPRDGYVKSGMGSALVQAEQPQAALRFFAEAASAGVPEFLLAKDRGLAFDMVGDNARAQADYALALKQSHDPEVERRLALSKAIAGDKAGALALLDPQINRRDRGAWRARAFVLALTGDTAGAVNAVRSQMPAQAAAMEPFLARLPQLSAADRAMAVHFGRFPNYVQTAAAAPVRAPYTAPPPAQRPAAPAAAVPSASQIAAQIRSTLSPPQPATAAPAPQYRPVQLPTAQPAAPAGGATPSAPVQTSAPAAVPASSPTQPFDLAASSSAPAPGIMAAELPASAAAVAVPQAEPATPAASAPIPTEAPLTTLRFADVAAAIASLPDTSEQATAQPEDAKPAPAPKPAAKPKPAAAKKAAPAPPREPSRIWVQLAAGQNKAVFPAEFKRIKAKAPKLLSDKTAWTTPLRATNRLLIGPFKTDKEARDLVNELSKLDIASYSWTSEAGQAVEKLPAK